MRAADADVSYAAAEQDMPFDSRFRLQAGDPLVDMIADSPTLATFVGEQTRLVWPADWDLRRIAIHDPTPVYPHSLIWRGDNPHPGLTALRDHLGSIRRDHNDAGTWTPKWAQNPVGYVQ